MKMHVPQPHQFLAPQLERLSVVVPGHYRYAGMDVDRAARPGSMQGISEALECCGRRAREDARAVHESPSMSAPPPPDTIAQLEHCLRAHPGTTATVAERSDLCFHVSQLKADQKDPALCRLWNYWKAEHSAGRVPTVGAFLNKERRK
jgi:hypothetical protein